jgi:hypothetical protein
MRKILVSLAALAAMAIAIPYVGAAKAATTVIVKKHYGHHWNMGPPRHGKTVVIKRVHRY